MIKDYGSLADYLKAVFYVHDTKEVKYKLRNFSLKALRDGKVNAVGEIKLIAPIVHVSLTDLRNVYQGDRRPIKTLETQMFDNVNDRKSLMDYLKVMAYLYGTDLTHLTSQLGKSSGYFNRLIQTGTFNHISDVLSKLWSIGFSIDNAVDAVAKSGIDPEKKANWEDARDIASEYLLNEAERRSYALRNYDRLDESDPKNQTVREANTLIDYTANVADAVGETVANGDDETVDDDLDDAESQILVFGDIKRQTSQPNKFIQHITNAFPKLTHQDYYF